MAVRMVTVHWHKRSDGCWYAFDEPNLARVYGRGLCVVWCSGGTPVTIGVRHGDLFRCAHDLYEDRAVASYRTLGGLWFTWALASTDVQHGAARYLTEQLKPAFGDVSALVPSIPVNLPE
jgi:hypothetical protein